MLYLKPARYEEACQYNFAEPDLLTKGSARFTQLVWNGSKQLGIGVAERKLDGKYCVFVVARYKPKGNVNDKQQYKINVKLEYLILRLTARLPQRKDFSLEARN